MQHYMKYITYELKDKYQISFANKLVLRILFIRYSAIYDFLTAQIEIKSGQLCLFPFYDFNIISIELIGIIYEILLGKEKTIKLSLHLSIIQITLFNAQLENIL